MIDPPPADAGRRARDARAHGVTKPDPQCADRAQERHRAPAKGGEPAKASELAARHRRVGKRCRPRRSSGFHALTGVELVDPSAARRSPYEWIANRPGEFKRAAASAKPVFGYGVRPRVGRWRGCRGAQCAGRSLDQKQDAPAFSIGANTTSRGGTFVGDWTRTGGNLMFGEDGFFWFGGRGRRPVQGQGPSGSPRSTSRRPWPLTPRGSARPLWWPSRMPPA